MSMPVLCTSQTRQSTCNIRHAIGLERVWVEGIPLMNCSLSLMCKCGGHLGRITGNSDVMRLGKGCRPTGQDRLFGRRRSPVEVSFGNRRSSAGVHLPGNGDSHAVRLVTQRGIGNKLCVTAV